MRPVSPRWGATLARSHGYVSAVTSWLGGKSLGAVPITAGQLTYDVTARGRRRCQLTVPLRADGRTWDPGTDPAHPLASFGQRLQIAAGIVHPGGDREMIPQGWYLITDTATDESAGTVTVTGSDLYQLMDESRVVGNPYGGFGPESSYADVVDHLTYVCLKNWWITDPQILPYRITGGLTDRQLAAYLEIPEQADRSDPLAVLCDSWPAQAAVNDAGELEISPPVTAPAATAVAVIAGDTRTGTLVSRGRQQARQRVYNATYTVGTDPGTGAVRATGRAERTTGPLSITGPYGWVSRWYSSPLLATNGQAQRTAETLLARGTLYARTESVTAVPDPSLELQDTVDVITTAGGRFRGLVSAITLPLTASGPMTLSVTTDTGAPA
ncbi:hypothetical protein ACIRQY_29125 [Streptomyces sp. NPDC101490]|uniref:hypothetical protein n=1 Tax=Streptomyces sp. NPDC101490 TaxID=3366143 RepID=UPI00380F4668